MLPEIQSGNWDRWKLYHLLNRAGFGVKKQELGMWSELSPQAAVDRLINWETRREVEVSQPVCAAKKDQWSIEILEFRQLPEQERREKMRAFQRILRQEMNELQQWWFSRMRVSPWPLQEKLALFWHGHFATSAQKVKNPHFMWKHLQIFRSLGNTDFRSILVAVSRDPAMLIWLDGARSQPKAPNENYARELMELFTLGEGNYTEKDIQESARAFTGWTIDRKNQEARFVARFHDPGAKSFMGKIGTFRDEDIIDIILARQECAPFLARKLWRFFASQSPSEAVVGDLANSLRVHKYHIKPVLRNLFLSKEFYSSSCVHNQVKSPLEFVVGTACTLGIKKPRDRMFMGICRLLGQEILQPPSVKGWDGGTAWINTSTLEMRNEFSRLLVMGGDASSLIPRSQDDKAQKQGSNLQKTDGMEAEMQMDGMREKMRNRLKNIPPQIPVETLISQASWKSREQLVTELSESVLMRPVSSKTRIQLLEALGLDEPVTPAQVRQCLLSMMTDSQYQLV